MSGNQHLKNGYHWACSLLIPNENYRGSDSHIIQNNLQEVAILTS